MLLPACWWHGTVFGGLVVSCGQGENGPRKTIVITGASSGIGRALTLRMSKVGWNVVACDIDVARLVQFKGVPNVEYVHLDVRSESSVKMLLTKIDI